MQFFALLNGRPTLFQGLFLKGSPLSPSFAFADDPITGFFLYGTSQLGVAVSGDWSVIFAPGGVIYGRQGNNRISLNSAGAIDLVAAGTNQNVTVTPSGTGKAILKLGDVDTQLVFEKRNTQDLALIAGNATGTIAKTIYLQGEMLHFGLGGIGEVARFNLSANFLIGKTTDSSNGRIQLADHTSSTGGIALRTNCSLYTNGPGSVRLDTILGTTGFTFDNGGSGPGGARILAPFGQLTITSNGANALVLQTGGTNAIIIDAAANTTTVGTLITTASVAGQAGLRVPHGVAPTAPANGDIWTTTAGLYVRINGATVGPLT